MLSSDLFQIDSSLYIEEIELLLIRRFITGGGGIFNAECRKIVNKDDAQFVV